MVAPLVKAVVLVRFPFSDLSASKLRPALVLAAVGRDDWILCQITSNPYSDPRAVVVTDADFASGGLRRISYARPGKIFSANSVLITQVAGILANAKHETIVHSIIALLRSGG